VSFNIACGTCKFCKKKYSSMCEYTNNSSMQEQMYGQRDAGFFGYGHLSELGCLSSGSDLVWAGLEHLSINPSRTSSETCTNAPDEVAEDAIDHR
jgi:Zn-dependent alcohol dehydrogenase